MLILHLFFFGLDVKLSLTPNFFVFFYLFIRYLSNPGFSLLLLFMSFSFIVKSFDLFLRFMDFVGL